MPICGEVFIYPAQPLARRSTVLITWGPRGFTPMDLSGLQILKQKLLEADDFAPVWDHFMSHFGERRAFMALGHRVRSPRLEAAIAQAAQEVFATPVPVANLLLMR